MAGRAWWSNTWKWLLEIGECLVIGPRDMLHGAKCLPVCQPPATATCNARHLASARFNDSSPSVSANSLRHTRPDAIPDISFLYSPSHVINSDCCHQLLLMFWLPCLRKAQTHFSPEPVWLAKLHLDSDFWGFGRDWDPSNVERLRRTWATWSVHTRFYIWWS